LVEGTPVQVISPAVRLELPLTELHQAGEPEIKRWVRTEAQQPFDLGQGPLLRARLLRRDEARHVLLLTMHLFGSDGWSMVVLFEELSTLYEAYRHGYVSPLRELTLQYADFAVWQREWLTGEVLKSQVSYWKQQLQGAPSVLELPVDGPRPLLESHRGASQSFTVAKDVSDQLRA
jgi:hypothetical protein